MSRISRGTPAGDAYLDLKTQARRSGRPTDELIQLYLLECFLARLVISSMRDKLVLKGGVLLATFGDRRPTRDVDLAGLDISNDSDAVLSLVRVILNVQLPDDGVEFDPDSATAEIIREEHEYAGVRVSASARLASARSRFHVDVNVGDPIWPEPAVVSLPRLLGGPPIVLAGYPLAMVYAEKIVTAVQRGTANTRWRDFADVWTLSNRHAVDGSDLQGAVERVARYRQAQLSPLSLALEGYAEIGQTKWAGWRRRNGYDHLPETFAEVLNGVVAFADPALAGGLVEQEWAPTARQWQ
jgi:hypothetical protein